MPLSDALPRAAIDVIVPGAGAPAAGVLDWPITRDLTGIEFRDGPPERHDCGVRPIGSFQMWPETHVPGWGNVDRGGSDRGVLTACLWACIPIAGRWKLTPALEFFRGKEWTGAPLHRQWNDWFNVGKGWPPEIETYRQHLNAPIGFMMVQGSQRLKFTNDEPASRQWQSEAGVRERTNLILVEYKADGMATVLAGGMPQEPAPEPLPPVQPPGEEVGPEIPPSLDAWMQEIHADIDDILKSQMRIEQAVAAVPSLPWIGTITIPRGVPFFGDRTLTFTITKK